MAEVASWSRNENSYLSQIFQSTEDDDFDRVQQDHCYSKGWNVSPNASVTIPSSLLFMSKFPRGNVGMNPQSA